eukprot:TRINITY_DN1382_c0_g1_i1.p1 TRINITY_DN1382_c0_g1~~TRINITY_DN1382_c0_g1_i1.p1  ORF type:complete len:434 (-),score=81.91 TRINITY_DN1382_c0_g1_i1:309-1610(-)
MLAIGYSSDIADIAYKLVIYDDMNYTQPLVTFCRRHTPERRKVTDISKLNKWETGNENLALMYEAASAALMITGTHADIFEAWCMARVVGTFGDCVAKYSGYPTPSVSSATGTLLQVITSRKFIVGDSRGGDDTYLNTTEDPTGPLHALNFAIVDWITKEYELSPPLELVYKFFSSTEEVFQALQNGTIDATTNIYYLGGYYNGTTRAESFRASCSSTCISSSTYTRKRDNITSLTQLYNIVAADSTLKLGGVGEPGQLSMQVLFQTYNTTVYKFNTMEDATQALLKEGVAVLADWQLAPPEGLTMFESGIMQPVVTFFRYDIEDGCADDVVDIHLGEECLSGSAGCSKSCHCSSGYHPHSPPIDTCEEDHMHKTNTVAIAVGVCVGFFGVLLFLLIVVVIVMVTSFPFIRKKYIKEGALQARFLLFRSRRAG